MTILDILIRYHSAFLEGLGVTLRLCSIVWFSGLAGGVFLGIMGGHNPKGWGRFVRGSAFLFSALPALVILFWLHYPAQAAMEVVIDPFYTAALTMSLINLFAVSESVRQAVVDFPKQYIVSGRVCGMSIRQIVRYIQFPILFRQLVPGLMVLQVSMLHISLFASLISVEEIFRVAQRINSMIYKPIEIYTALAFFFLLVCLPIHLFADFLQRRYTRDFSER
ncbi:MAG TPA: hypothetical protein DD400_04400 [Rhodospirillaceae bacterium]|nr:hypothetical protein [Rhodospirillaceae bacterium]